MIVPNDIVTLAGMTIAGSLTASDIVVPEDDGKLSESNTPPADASTGFDSIAI